MRWFLLVLFALAACARAAPEPDLRIVVTQTDMALRVVYEWRRPQKDLLFGALSGGHRERRWTIETPGFDLVRLDEGDRVARVDGARFSRVELIARADLIRLPKEYQPMARYGEGGLLVYTGHFWPLTRPVSAGGGRVNAVFDFIPQSGGAAVAFGDRKAALHDWRSPMAHPAFVYLGPAAPVETEHLMALIDLATPQWIVDLFNEVTPKGFARLAEVFGFTPEVKPNLFLAAPLGNEAARLSYSGDALPGQFQITLAGGAWRTPSDKARRIFIHSTLHEAVHLWQAQARPSLDPAPDWIHEGAADAIAAELMVTLGEWDGAAFETDERRARSECARGLEDGTLNGAANRGDFRALYACGHVAASAVARAEGASVAEFWRAFVANNQGEAGYSEADFYDLVAMRTGDKAFTAALRRFARAPLASPAREIDALMAAASAASRNRPVP